MLFTLKANWTWAPIWNFSALFDVQAELSGNKIREKELDISLFAITIMQS